MSKDQSGRASGPSQRQLRVGEVIRRALSEIFARGDLHAPGLSGASITVSEVRPSPDLRQARVFVMPLGGANANEIVDALNDAAKEVRREMNRTVTLKFSPQLSFVLDQSFDLMDSTRAMLAQPSVARDLDK
ncbi:30S ribosome-binding factor RbfA [Rhodobacteraceae bacterium NNCM2]|nr:30S ribosome-binding factor RbfA [Coraliihabitans acroporae]